MSGSLPPNFTEITMQARPCFRANVVSATKRSLPISIAKCFCSEIYIFPAVINVKEETYVSMPCIPKGSKQRMCNELRFCDAKENKFYVVVKE